MWAPSKPTGERYKKVNVLDSEYVSETLYKHCENLVQTWCKHFANIVELQAAPEVDMEPFDDNGNLYHHFMTLFKEDVANKVQDPRGRLIRLLKYTSGEAKELMNHCIQIAIQRRF